MARQLRKDEDHCAIARCRSQPMRRSDAVAASLLGSAHARRAPDKGIKKAVWCTAQLPITEDSTDGTERRIAAPRSVNDVATAEALDSAGGLFVVHARTSQRLRCGWRRFRRQLLETDLNSTADPCEEGSSAAAAGTAASERYNR